MKTFGLLVLLSAIVATGLAFDRVVVCEEAYQET
jgi:hypothetical protein